MGRISSQFALPHRSRLSAIASAVGCVVAIFVLTGLSQLLAGVVPNEWYEHLPKPSFTPPGWLFGPVWTLLYVMMAIAAWWVAYSRPWRQVRMALSLFALQLALNLAWTPLFFGLHNPSAALFCLAALWISLAATTARFLGLSRFAGVMLVPCLAWCSFALVLNAAFVYRM